MLLSVSPLARCSADTRDKPAITSVVTNSGALVGSEEREEGGREGRLGLPPSHDDDDGRVMPRPRPPPLPLHSGRTEIDLAIRFADSDDVDRVGIARCTG